LAQIYGQNNPIFDLNTQQFNDLVIFFKYRLSGYIINSIKAEEFRPKNQRNPDLIRLSQSLTISEFICYLFQDYPNNFKQLFQWFERELFLLEYPRNALLMMSKFLIALAHHLPEKSVFFSYVNRELFHLLKRHKVVEIQVVWQEEQEFSLTVNNLKNLDKFLKQLAHEFNLPNLTLARLLDSHLTLFLADHEGNFHLQCDTKSDYPTILQCQFSNWHLFFKSRFHQSQN